MRCLEILDKTPSTNVHLQNIIEKTRNIPNLYTVFAHEQTHGKGQYKSTWVAERKKNLTISQYWRLKSYHTKNLFYLNMAVSLAVKKTVELYCSNVSIKWPNDILVNKKKISGILLEPRINNNFVSFIIIGIGINVNQRSFHSLTARRVTSIILERKNKISLFSFLESLLDYLESYRELIFKKKFNKIKKLYIESLFGFDKWNNLRSKDGSIFRGKIVNVLSTGEILIMTSDNVENKFTFKEFDFLY